MSLVVDWTTWGIPLLDHANIYSLTLEFSVLHSTSPGARTTMFSNAILRNLFSFKCARLLHRSVALRATRGLDGWTEQCLHPGILEKDAAGACEHRIRSGGHVQGEDVAFVDQQCERRQPPAKSQHGTGGTSRYRGTRQPRNRWVAAGRRPRRYPAVRRSTETRRWPRPVRRPAGPRLHRLPSSRRRRRVRRAAIPAPGRDGTLPCRSESRAPMPTAPAPAGRQSCPPAR